MKNNKTSISIAEDNAYEDCLDALYRIIPNKPQDTRDFEAYLTYKSTIETLIELITEHKRLSV